jgi:pimeloyl-ACP methyl ester carboxylesterase
MRTHVLTSSAAVPGGRLRYLTQGAGPLLLVVAGGHGDATKGRPLGAHLADEYTVMTYDRRGLSESVTEGPARSLTEHAEDASRLLAQVTDEPAYVFGSSIGGMIALTLASAHPEQVRTVVAHEPPALGLLPETERQRAVAGLLAVEQAFADHGVDAALTTFVEMADIDPTDREPHVPAAPRTPQEVANFELLVRHDLPAIRRHAFDVEALATSGATVVPAVGSTSAHTWPHACGRLLADALGVPSATLPGGHLGYVQRPRETAARVRDVLATHRRQGHPSR